MTEANTPEVAFARHSSERNLVAARICAILGAVLMPAGITLDLATNPDRVVPFLMLRLGASALALLLLLVSRTPGAVRFTYLLGIGPVLICSISIQLMVEALGGYASPYYAGLNLCILGVGVLFTWTVREAMLACALVISIWLIPSFFHDPTQDFGAFFNNLYFLLATSVIAVASNANRYRQTHREFDASYQLNLTSKQLELALSQLKELDRVKTEFFTNISHELRTPLTLILTPVEDRLEARLSKEEEFLFETIHRNAYRLLRLIDDLLDLSRIDAGRLRIQVAPVDLPQLARHGVESFRPAAASRSIQLEIDAPDSGSNGLYGDEHRLEMVLTNLLGNALKFTPDGGRIRVVVSHDASLARFSVIDSGPGISAEDQKKVFDRFYRVEGPEHRAQGGAGIGLSLARQLIELHGGVLAVESEEGSGASFTAILPLGRDHFRPEVLERRRMALDVPGGRRASDLRGGAGEEPDVLHPVPSDTDLGPRIVLEGGRRARIVLVEDNGEIRSLIERLLRPDFDVLSATDGVEGLELVRRERPDLLVSDVMMPRLSGTELCARIKADPELQGTPVILLTARSGPEAVLEGYAHGADDFVTKPLHPRILVARVRAQLRLRALSLQVLSQAKLAAVGTLAAGIGHEVRNPVNAVVNGARTLLERHSLEPATRRVLEVIEDAGSRIEAITGALLDHAHPGEQDHHRPCDVAAGIEATLRLLEHRSGDITIHRQYESNRQVIASPAELNQVFLNLLDNAIRFEPQNVWVRVSRTQDRLAVTVSDDGPGVPPEIAQRIFDPFFTTRDPGGGTGLGLYLSGQIIARHGGVLRHAARPEGGAIFTIELPLEEAA